MSLTYMTWEKFDVCINECPSIKFLQCIDFFALPMSYKHEMSIKYCKIKP